MNRFASIEEISEQLHKRCSLHTYRANSRFIICSFEFWFLFFFAFLHYMCRLMSHLYIADFVFAGLSITHLTSMCYSESRKKWNRTSPNQREQKNLFETILGDQSWSSKPLSRTTITSMRSTPRISSGQ